MTMTEFKQALGKLIFEMRRQRRLSQEKLASEAGIDRTRMGEIERGEANPTIGILEKIAQSLGLTLGSLLVQAEELSHDQIRQPAPKVDPRYLDRTVHLPSALTHDQLETALNRALTMLAQLALNPAEGDIPWNVYSATVAKSVARALAGVSRLVWNSETRHPALYDLKYDPSEAEWGVEVTASQHIGKGGESTTARQGWLMVIAYQIIDGQTRIVQVETALLSRSEWAVHERGQKQRRLRTAVTIASATQRLRENSVYLDPAYVNPTIRKSAEARRRARLS